MNSSLKVNRERDERIARFRRDKKFEPSRHVLRREQIKVVARTAEVEIRS